MHKYNTSGAEGINACGVHVRHRSKPDGFERCWDNEAGSHSPLGHGSSLCRHSCLLLIAAFASLSAKVKSCFVPHAEQVFEEGAKIH